MIWTTPGLDDVAVHPPQLALGVTAKLTRTSGVTPQFGWPEFGHVSGVDVPVAGTLLLAGLRPIEQGVVKLAVALWSAFMVMDWGFAAPLDRRSSY